MLINGNCAGCKSQVTMSLQQIIRSMVKVGHSLLLIIDTTQKSHVYPLDKIYLFIIIIIKIKTRKIHLKIAIC